MPTEPAAVRAPVIEVRDLELSYGDIHAVRGLSFSASAGEVLALLGPNGAGKTSTVECLEGYKKPTAGEVRVLGLDPVNDHGRLVVSMGVMLQRGGIYPTMGARDALRLFASYYDEPEDPAALLELLGLTNVERTPWKLLSGGEQQRLSLALCLIGRPSVVFLDEPTAGVDPEGRLVIRQVISDLRARNVCVVLTSHELGEVERLADRVIIVAAGEVVASGTQAELASSEAPTTRFVTSAGLVTDELATILGATVVEVSPGSYQVSGGDQRAAGAAIATWLQRNGAPLERLSTTSTLEETYLRLIGTETSVAAMATPSRRRRRR